MALEMNTDKVICPTCGTGYSKRKGFFPVSYGELYKGLGYIPYCRSCIDKIYSQYLAQCKDSKMAVRQTCRKLDLYWNESIFDSVVKKSSVRSLMTQYIVRINSVSCAGNALSLSIKADQSLTFGIVRSIEDAVNRFIQSQSYGKNFKVTFLDVSPYNRKEMGDAYLKAASYGLPTIAMYAASQGLGQAELDAMSFLETEVMGLQDMFRPIQSSTQMSGNTTSTDSNAPTDEGGRPQSDETDLTDSGEQSAEQSSDWG